MAVVTSAASAAAARIGAALSDAQYFESSMIRIEDIRRQLDSRHTKEKLDAMKRVIALICLGKDASTFFPDVVKNVVATSLDVKKIVYLYLVHYAEQKQDLALLAVNSFQKDLSDHNQHIRALSLRVLSSIRVKVILQVVIHAISKAAKDSSAYVRNAAAHAIGKVCALDVASRELLLQPLQDLIADRATQVMGSAIAAYEDVCPNKWQLIHPHYRRICHSLDNVGPWGQISLSLMLLRYARAHFAKPSDPRNPDIRLLLDSVKPLFFSLNNAVVAAALAIYFHIASPKEFSTYAVKPLMRLVAIEDDGGQAVALTIASAVAARFPALLISYVSEFYVSAAHSALIRNLRMHVLTRICSAAGKEGGIGSKPHARQALLLELKDYLHRSDSRLAASTARAIGCLATAHPASTPVIVKVLSSVVNSADDPAVVSESIAVLRRLLQRHPSAQAKALPQLIAMLLAAPDKGAIHDPAARASIIWLIGEFYEEVQVVATEALRLLSRGFAKEAAEVKLQILNLAAKVVAWGERESGASSSAVPPRVRRALLEYVVSCARYDRDYDVRDKARMLNSVFSKNADPKLYRSACAAFLSRKPTPLSPDDAGELDDDLEPDVVIGSMTHVLRGRRLSGFLPLEPFKEADSDSALREEIQGDGHGAAADREYVGVGSADYHGYGERSFFSAVEPPAGVSSQDLSRNITTDPPISSLGVSSSQVLSLHSNPSRNTGDLLSLDPETFYADEGSAGYDSDTEGSEDDDDESQEGEPTRPNAGNVPQDSSPENVLSDLFLGSSDSPAPSKGVAGDRSPYDLDALINSMAEVPTFNGEKKAAPSLPRLPSVDANSHSPWRRVFETWQSAGLEVDMAFSRATSSLGGDVTPVLFRVINRTKVKAVISFESQSGDSLIPESLNLTLAPEESGETTVSARFRGKTSGLRFALRNSNVVAGSAEVKPPTGFVLKPQPNLSPGDFIETEKSLTGMFGTETSLRMQYPQQNDWIHLSSAIRDRLLETCFVSHIKTSIGSAADAQERFCSSFAGYLPGEAQTEQRTVLLKVTVRFKDEDSCEGRLWIGCEDVLFSANLMQICRKAVLDSAQH